MTGITIATVPVAEGEEVCPDTIGHLVKCDLCGTTAAADADYASVQVQAWRGGVPVSYTTADVCPACWEKAIASIVDI